MVGRMVGRRTAEKKGRKNFVLGSPLEFRHCLKGRLFETRSYWLKYCPFPHKIGFLHMVIRMVIQPEIVEMTFRSRFRFRFLKYPLFKKVIFKDIPGNEKKRLLYFGYPKRNDFLKRGYFRFWKRLGTKKRNESKRNGNVPELSKILGTKKSFPLSLLQKI